MTHVTDATEEVLADLLRRSHVMEPQTVGGYIDEAARSLGAAIAMLYLVDLQQRELVPLGPDGEVAGAALAIDATLAGRAFISGQVLTAGATEDQHAQLWVPLVDGSDRLGVMRLDMADAGEQSHRTALTLASLAAELLVSKGPYTDAFHRVSRRQDMSLAAEMQWAMLPPLTLSTPRVAVAAILEVTVVLSRSAVRVEVRDQSPLAPEIRHYDEAASTGRGLALVDALATRWGTAPQPGGKVVWFELGTGELPAGALRGLCPVAGSMRRPRRRGRR
jgi:hypothetical protein